MFNVTIITSYRLLYQSQAWSVFLPGVTGEFEVLELHKSVISRLKKGKIVVDWDKRIPINDGVVMMKENELLAVVQE